MLIVTNIHKNCRLYRQRFIYTAKLTGGLVICIFYEIILIYNNQISPDLKKLLKITFTLIFTTILLLGFAVPLNPNGNWYQQFLPNLGNRQISDITFLDSLTGYSVTNNLSPGDTGYILKTTNGGDIWNYYFTVNRGFTALDFININTGYACGGSGGGTTYLSKTTNAGLNWFLVNSPSAEKWDDMSVLNNDTIWLVESENLTGGVFTTMNGGLNWTVNNSIKPDKIYMYNSRIGFCSRSGTSLYKTTNGGVSWSTIIGENGFRDIHFIDSLNGWKANGTMKKTTDGGLNWSAQVMPSGGIFTFTGALKIAVLNRDTIWAVGGAVQYPNLQSRGVIYRTTNGGDTWKFQIPDTSLQTGTYFSHIQFVNYRAGWAYTLLTGIHTTNGGDTNWLLPLTQISTEVPKEFRLFQNFPNPFNPVTNIGFRISGFGFVTLKIFDITGREISELINKELKPGEYNIDWNASGYSSGVYFYKLTVNSGKEVFTETRKMIMIK